jgi:uncharacterized C2H2 Zn-finger protein
METRYLPPPEALDHFIEERQRMFRRYDEIAEQCAATMAELLSLEKRFEKIRRRSAWLTNRCAKHALKCLCGHVFASSYDNRIHVTHIPTIQMRDGCMFFTCPQCRSLYAVSERQVEILLRFAAGVFGPTLGTHAI